MFLKKKIKYKSVLLSINNPLGFKTFLDKQNLSRIFLWFLFGQVTLYSIMSSDRRPDPGQGLLLYLKQPDMKMIEVDHLNKRGGCTEQQSLFKINYCTTFHYPLHALWDARGVNQRQRSNPCQFHWRRKCQFYFSFYLG